jgi:hypothetical protein
MVKRLREIKVRRIVQLDTSPTDEHPDTGEAPWRCEQCFRVVYAGEHGAGTLTVDVDECYVKTVLVHQDDDTPVCDFTYRAEPWRTSEKCL